MLADPHSNHVRQDQPTTPTGGSVPASPFVQTSGRSETAPVSTLLAPPSAPAAGPLMAASARPRTAELPQKMSCFGIRSGARSMGSRNPTEEDELGEDEKVVKPARAEPAVAPVLYGMVGLKSIGARCCCRNVQRSMFWMLQVHLVGLRTATAVRSHSYLQSFSSQDSELHEAIGSAPYPKAPCMF